MGSREALYALLTPKIRERLVLPSRAAPTLQLAPEDHARIQRLRRWILALDVRTPTAQLRNPSEVMTLAISRGVDLLRDQTIAREGRQPLRMSALTALDVMRLAQSSSMATLALRMGLDDLEQLRARYCAQTFEPAET